jgi:hypothetical protein
MDPTERARLRFQDMLMSAELAAERVAQDRLGVIRYTSSAVAVTTAMNRAAGFLEALNILLPALSAELLEEFEAVALRVEALEVAGQANGERRIADSQGSQSDRREWDRRRRHERRHHSMAMSVERRLTPDRRGEPDRRSGKIRELADRRWRAIQR